jgi:hypothetical protein
VTRHLVIETGSEGKGRSFRAELLGYCLADHLWEGGSAVTNRLRPAVLVIAASEAQVGPVVANLRGGRKALLHLGQSKPKQLELLKSAGYAFSAQRHPEGVVVTAYLPELVRIDPGMVDPSGARFLMLPSAAWLRAEVSRFDLGAAVQHVERTVAFRRTGASLDEVVPYLAAAPLFAAYLDRRVRAPIVPDVRFHAQVLAAALRDGYASCARSRSWGWGHREIAEEHLDECGFAPGVAFSANHTEIEELLAEQVGVFFGAKRRAA